MEGYINDSISKVEVRFYVYCQERLQVIFENIYIISGTLSTKRRRCTQFIDQNYNKLIQAILASILKINMSNVMRK